MTNKLYQNIASALVARANCQNSDNATWAAIWTHRLTKELHDALPHGSGFDSGVELDLAASTPNKLVLLTGFHHMDDNGCYDGWTHHAVIVTPDLAHGFNLRVTGRDKREIKDFIAEALHGHLNTVHDRAAVS